MIQISDRNHAATKQAVAMATPIAGSGNQYRSARTRIDAADEDQRWHDARGERADS